MEANTMTLTAERLADQIIENPAMAQQSPIRLSSAEAEVKSEIVRQLKKLAKTILTTGPVCG